MKKTLTGTNPDGSPHFHYDFSDEPEGVTILKTGPIAGAIALSDGTVYDVTEEYVAIKGEHLGPLQHHIHRMHNALGALDLPEHECSDECGTERIAKAR